MLTTNDLNNSRSVLIAVSTFQIQKHTGKENFVVQNANQNSFIRILRLSQKDMRMKFSDYKKQYKEIILKSARHGEYPCFYCGLPSSSIDHFIPQSHTKSLLAFVEINGIMRKEAEEILLKQELIPSCRECNSILGNKIFNTPDQKKIFLKKRLKIKNKNILSSPKWEDEDIKELDYMLRSFVRGSMTRRDIILNRISW